MEDSVVDEERKVALEAEKLATELFSTGQFTVFKSMSCVSWIRLGYMHFGVLVDDGKKKIGEISAGRESPVDPIEALSQKMRAQFVVRDASKEEADSVVIILRVPTQELKMASARFAAIQRIWAEGRISYNLQSNNCEHVSRFITTGLFDSSQSQLLRNAQNVVLENPKKTIVIGVAAAAAAAIGAYW